MRRTLLLCLLSALAGVAAAVAWYESPATTATSAADEIVRPVQYAPTPHAPPRVDLKTRVAASAPLPAAPEPINQQDLTPEERVNVTVYQNVNRSVVNINTRAVQSDRFLFFEVPTEGEGSGTVLDRRGHILTNFHVVDGAREVQVTLYDGKTYDARLVGADSVTDVAVLQIDAPSETLHPVAFGSSTGLMVGQRVYAIGNPFGLERTLTTGIISSLNRSLPARHGLNRTIKSIIQIDAAINPGNSGGPLLDSHGRMIGMNTAIASKTGESAGVGFAIPINTIARVVPQLVETGRIRRPESGIAKVQQTERGLLVLAMLPNGAAEKAGLRGPKIVKQRKRQGFLPYDTISIDRSAADIIVAVDGQPVKTGDDYLGVIEAKKPGEEVLLTVIREGREQKIPLRLEVSD